MSATAATTAHSAADAPKKDNILGICNALGEDFGFNPIYLRVALALAFLVSPKAVIAAYAAAGVAVLASRLIVRRRPAARVAAAASAPSPTVVALPAAERRDTDTVAPTRELIAA